MQFGFFVITLLISIFGGIFTGYLLRWIAPKHPIEQFDDKEYWEVPEIEYEEEGHHQSEHQKL
jgi:hypothetical protein